MAERLCSTIYPLIFQNMRINVNEIVKDPALCKMAAEHLAYGLSDVQCYDELTPKEKEIISLEGFEKIYISSSCTYKSIKESNPNHIILIRCGHSYDTFDEDAVKVSSILGIKLDIGFGEGDRNQRVSFPRHALDTYLPKLIRAGHRVAICDNL